MFCKVQSVQSFTTRCSDEGMTTMTTLIDLLQHMTWLAITECLVTNGLWYVLFVVITIWFFPHSQLITMFVTRIAWRVSRVEQELLTPPEHLTSPLLCSGVHVTRYLVIHVVFCTCQSLLIMLTFFSFLGSTVWLMMCTVIGIPVSASYSIIGAELGYHVQKKGISNTNWTYFTKQCKVWFGLWCLMPLSIIF